MFREKFDVAVIGAGAAGLAAAIGAREEGGSRVLILERDRELGGILPQCIHTGFGLRYFRENLTGPEYVHRFIQRVEDLRIECLLDTMVIKVNPDKSVLATNSSFGPLTIRAKAIVLAMGCRERTRGAIVVPGTRPAGIFTAGTAQRLLDIEGFLPGREIVVLGSGDVGMIVARRFATEGAHVKAVVEKTPYLGGLERNEVQCLRDFNIPLLLEHTVVEIHGKRRVEAVTLAKVDNEGSVVPGSEKRLLCDTLVLSVGLIPENELSEAAGIEIDPRTNGPKVDENMQTSVEGIFACGNVVHVNDLVDSVTEAGEIAGRCGAQYALGRLRPIVDGVEVLPGPGVRYVIPHKISGRKPVKLQLRATEPLLDARVRVGRDLEARRRVVKPPQVVEVMLTGRMLEKLEKGSRITVTVEGRSS